MSGSSAQPDAQPEAHSETQPEVHQATHADGTARTHDYYGVPLWLLKEYLVGLGGVETAPDVVEGPGWRAALRKAVPRRIGSLAVGGASAEFSGDEPALAALFEQLHWRTLRGGG